MVLVLEFGLNYLKPDLIIWIIKLIIFILIRILYMRHITPSKHLDKIFQQFKILLRR